jgi:addiction module HigA family antidote
MTPPSCSASTIVTARVDLEHSIEEENLPAATSPTAAKRPEYQVRRPLQRAPVHPGALMRELLKEHVRITIAEAARRRKVSRPALYSVLNGTAAVTAEMALRFARLTGGTPELYLNMQAGHDLELARQRLKDELAGIEPGPQNHPSAAVSAVKEKRDPLGNATSVNS